MLRYDGHFVVRQFGGPKRNFNREEFSARGYAVSTVGFEEANNKDYIRNQEQPDVQDCHAEDNI